MKMKRLKVVVAEKKKDAPAKEKGKEQQSEAAV
jgi:hypothetical protein